MKKTTELKAKELSVRIVAEPNKMEEITRYLIEKIGIAQDALRVRGNYCAFTVQRGKKKS